MVSEPRRIQLSRRKGWRMPTDTVRVSRPGPWGNPFMAWKGDVYANPQAVHFVIRGSITACAAEAFKMWLDGHLIQAEALEFYRTRRSAILGSLPAIRGKNLACWCRLDTACHADVLLDLANRPVCEAA